MKRTLLTGVFLAPVVATSANADFTGLAIEHKVDELTQANNLLVLNPYATFNDPNDRLLSIGFAEISTGYPTGFFQHPLGRDTAPLDFLIPIDPLVAYDSFVTIGVKVNGGTDGTTTDPDFDSDAFNNDDLLAGGWFNNNPDNGQGDPVDGIVLIAQLTIQSSTGLGIFSGSITVFWRDGDTGDIIGTEIYIPTPGALATLALVASIPRRRRAI